MAITQQSFDSLMEKIDEIQKDISAIKQSEAARLEREKHDTAQLTRHETALYGNGKEGLIACVAKMQTAIEGKATEAEVADVKNNSIVLWIRKHQPATIVIVAVLIELSYLVDLRDFMLKLLQLK